MKERPIIFNSDMVRAILAGRKTQTRRIVKTTRPPFQEGDLLYVRETWAPIGQFPGEPLMVWYKADYPNFPDEMPDGWDEEAGCGWSKDRWHPSIHMPKEVARIWLKVTKVRKDKIRNIGEWDSFCEGVTRMSFPLSRKETYREAFQRTWSEIYGCGSWDLNDMVWVIEFKRMMK